MGHRQAPSVVKVAAIVPWPRSASAFERVEAVLGNNAPRVTGLWSTSVTGLGLKYSYAAMGQGRVRTLRSMFAAGLPTGQLVAVVRAAFEEVLGPLYAAAQYERLPLFEYYGFSGRARSRRPRGGRVRSTGRKPGGPRISRRVEAAQRGRVLRGLPAAPPTA